MSRLRVLTGFVIAAATLAAALWLHTAKAVHLCKYDYVSISCPNVYRYEIKASWQDPLAVFVILAGLGAATVTAAPRRPQMS
jgi:hypothetical protein